MKKVMISGCYDLLHSGHIAFFETASEYGKLYVCIGSDKNISKLKNKKPLYSELERLYMVKSIKYVFEAKISKGEGYLDFEEDIKEIRPDIFLVNNDGDMNEKKILCDKYNVKYIVLPRVPKKGLEYRSSTQLKKEGTLPYRICLAGGWMDQPFINNISPGSVVTIQVERKEGFMKRSGMATSTRNTWQRLLKYHNNLDSCDNLEELARLLFACENPPGSKYISGSQDAIGLTHPGINKLYYKSNYWPVKIDTCLDNKICDWLEKHLVLVPISERPSPYNPLLEKNISLSNVNFLSSAGNLCFQSILNMDLIGLGKSFTDTYNAWRKLLPFTSSYEIDKQVSHYLNFGTGAVLSGCGGGYIILATDKKIESGFQISIIR